VFFAPVTKGKIMKKRKNGMNKRLNRPAVAENRVNKNTGSGAGFNGGESERANHAMPSSLAAIDRDKYPHLWQKQMFREMIKQGAIFEKVIWVDRKTYDQMLWNLDESLDKFLQINDEEYDGQILCIKVKCPFQRILCFDLLAERATQSIFMFWHRWLYVDLMIRISVWIETIKKWLDDRKVAKGEN
jgi:hypothetical protein